MLFCEICKIIKSIFFAEHFWWLLLEISYELSLYCIREWWIVSLCGTYWLSSAYFIIGRVFRFFLFLFFFLIFFWFTTCLCIEVSLSILKIKQWSGSYIRKWSFQGWVPSALLNITNVIGLVPFGKKLGYILLPLTSLELLAVEYLRETNISNFIYHLLMITCSLHALKKSPKRKEMRIKNEKVQVLQQTIYSRKETWK